MILPAFCAVCLPFHLTILLFTSDARRARSSFASHAVCWVRFSVLRCVSNVSFTHIRHSRQHVSFVLTRLRSPPRFCLPAHAGLRSFTWFQTVRGFLPRVRCAPPVSLMRNRHDIAWITHAWITLAPCAAPDRSRSPLFCAFRFSTACGSFAASRRMRQDRSCWFMFMRPSTPSDSSLVLGLRRATAC